MKKALTLIATVLVVDLIYAIARDIFFQVHAQERHGEMFDIQQQMLDEQRRQDEVMTELAIRNVEANERASDAAEGSHNASRDFWMQKALNELGGGVSTGDIIISTDQQKD